MRNFKTNFLSLSHLPTWILIIGFPVYWVELFFNRANHGVTTPCAWIMWIIIVLVALKYESQSWNLGKRIALLPKEKFNRLLLVIGICLSLFILAIFLYASLLPPHLVQEEDVLNYHYTFPRQHLIRNSFAYIPWSTADLFPFEVQAGLAPFWFVTQLPNKFPQFLFLLAIPFISVRLLSHLGKFDYLKKALVVFAVLGAHHVAIQGGTAMLDIVLAYLFLAALDSLLSGNWEMAAVEFVFYFWSKSFIPLQMIAVLGALVVLIFVFRKFGCQVYLGFSKQATVLNKDFQKIPKKFFVLFGVLSIVIAGPFLWKSVQISGSPLYPFFVGSMPYFQNVDEQPLDWSTFVAAANFDLSMKDAFGLPRTVGNFIQHFWLVGVPQEGVNNVFDYPLGLVYLLCIGPFIWYTARSLLKREISVLAFFIIIVWMSWWFGSQQSRFLFVPLFLMYVIVIAQLKSSRVFFVIIVLALFFSSVSVFRAHRPDFGKSALSLLRPQDQKFVSLSKSYIEQGRTGIEIVERYECAYAQFPTSVLEEKIPFVIQMHLP